MRMRKGSRWPFHLRMGDQYVDHLSACDLFLIDEIVWPAAQFVWLPIQRQCKTCRAVVIRNHPGHGAPDVDYETCDTHSATPLMLTTIEIVLHAFAGWCVAMDTQGTHADRGCYFELCHEVSAGRIVETDPRSNCHCGSFSWLDWASAQVMATDAREAIRSELNRRQRAWTVAAIASGDAWREA